MLKSPCYGCAERVLYCHSTCERYLAFQDKCKAIQTERYNDLVANSALSDGNNRKYGKSVRSKGTIGKKAFMKKVWSTRSLPGRNSGATKR